MKTPRARRLPPRPDIDQLRRQAKDLRKAYLAGHDTAVVLVESFGRASGDNAAAAGSDVDTASDGSAPGTRRLPLHEAQLILARSFGFKSWPRLKAYVDGINVKRLVTAVRAGDADSVGAILDATPELVNTDLAENDQHRAIHYAVLGRSVDLVRVLMRRGADARQGIHPHREPTSALTIASDRGYDEIVAVIREEEEQRAGATAGSRSSPTVSGAESSRPVSAAPVAESSRPASPLADAVKEDRIDDLRDLIARGYDPDEPIRLEGLEEPVYSSGGPLWHSAVGGKLETARLLLEAGADPNAMVYAGGTPVFQAYGQRDDQMIELLERHDGKPDAATLGHYRKTERAAEMLATGERGELPEEVHDFATLVEELLWSAACGGDPEIVRMALAHTDWSANDRRWYRMLEQPLRLWNHLPSFWANESFERGTYLTCFDLLLERCDPDVAGRFGMRILHDLAAARRHVTDIEQAQFAAHLLAAGARGDFRDDLLLSTPLGWACRWGRVELVELLLAHGADPIEADAQPWATPRAWAEKRGHEEVVRLLDGAR